MGCADVAICIVLAGIRALLQKDGTLLSEKEFLKEHRHLQNQSQQRHLCLPQLMPAAVPGEIPAALRLLFSLGIKIP